MKRDDDHEAMGRLDHRRSMRARATLWRDLDVPRELGSHALAFHAVNALAEKWLAAGRAVALPEHMATTFDEYVNSLPWFSSSLDWSGMPPCVDLDMNGKRNPAYGAWLARTRLSVHSHLAVWYPGAAGIVVPMMEGLRALDALYHPNPGSHFCFGVDVGGTKMRAAYSDILEYTFNQHYIAPALVGVH